MLPPIFKLVSIVALVQDPIFHKLVIQDVPDHVGGIGPEVPDNVIPEKNIVNQGCEDVLALIGHAPGLVHGQGLGHDPVKLPAVVADVIEGLAILIFRVLIREGKIEIPNGVNPFLF